MGHAARIPKALGADYGERALTLLGDAPAAVWETIEKHAIDCDPVRNGTLHCAVGASGLAEIEERARQWGERGAPVRVLTAAEAAKRIGSDAYAGALLDHARRDHPAARLCARACPRGDRGGRRDPYPEPGPRGRADRRRVAAHNRRRRRSRPTGSRSRPTPMAARPGRRGVASRSICPISTSPRRRLAPTCKPAILPGREGCWDTKTILSSFRFDRAGRLVFGSVGALRGTGLPIHRAWAKRALRKIFPSIGRIEFEQQWYGMIGMTDNALPRFHRLADRMS